MFCGVQAQCCSIAKHTPKLHRAAWHTVAQRFLNSNHWCGFVVSVWYHCEWRIWVKLWCFEWPSRVRVNGYSNVPCPDQSMEASPSGRNGPTAQCPVEGPLSTVTATAQTLHRSTVAWIAREVTRVTWSATARSSVQVSNISVLHRSHLVTCTCKNLLNATVPHWHRPAQHMPTPNMLNFGP